MRIFHMADLHIGITLYNRDLSEDQRYVLRQVIDYATQYVPDVVVIAGDIYDRSVPSAEAVALFDWFIGALTEAVPKASIMMIAGNHDSAQRIDCYRNILCRQNIFIAGLAPQKNTEYMQRITISDTYGDVDFYLLPFIRPAVVRGVLGYEDMALSYDEAVHQMIAREQIDTARRNVLVTHQFYIPVGEDIQSLELSESEIHTVGNIDSVRSDALMPFDYVAMGHIHKMSQVGKTAYRYSGTPMAYSVSEASQEKGILMIDLCGKEEAVQVTGLPLTPLHAVRKLRGTLEEVLRQSCDDYVAIELTDQELEASVDLSDRLQHAFCNLLEVRRVFARLQNYDAVVSEASIQAPLELIDRFMPDMTEEERTVMEDVWNTVRGGDHL